MNYFVIGYYALLIGASCVTAYTNKRGAFMLLFSLTLVSFVVGIVGGASPWRPARSRSAAARPTRSGNSWSLSCRGSWQRHSAPCP